MCTMNDEEVQIEFISAKVKNAKATEMSVK